MTDKRGKPICPKCGYHLMARSDNKIFCLRNGCDWITDWKRKEDLEKIPEIHELKQLWQ